MPTGTTPTATHYALIIDNTPVATFTECRDLGTKNEIVEHRMVTKGSKAGIIRKIPGALNIHNVVLTRPATKDFSLSNWRREVENGQADRARKNGEIVVYDVEGRIIARWMFRGAWPSKLVTTFPEATEELTLACEMLSRVVNTQ